MKEDSRTVLQLRKTEKLHSEKLRSESWTRGKARAPETRIVRLDKKYEQRLKLQGEKEQRLKLPQGATPRKEQRLKLP